MRRTKLRLASVLHSIRRHSLGWALTALSLGSLPLSAAEPVSVAEAAQQVLARQEIHLGHDSLAFVRIRPPQLPPPPPPAPASPTEPAAPALEAPGKPQLILAVQAEVYLGLSSTAPALTRLTWRHDDQTYHAWSNADFRLLTQISSEETATHHVLWFPFVSETDTPPTPQPPALTALAAQPAAAPVEYLFEGDAARAAQTEPVLAFLDLLHARYTLHRDELHADLLRRRAEEAELRRAAEVEAARPKRQTLYYWKMSAEEAAR